MNNEKRWEYLTSLDEELLQGGIVLSEWCACIVREADLAFVHSAHLATILTAMSGIETHLRWELCSKGNERLVELLDRASIPAGLKEELHALRKYRNGWVHVADPWEDTSPLERPTELEDELERMAFRAVRLLRQTIYLGQSV
jgi:hypothetical protein